MNLHDFNGPLFVVGMPRSGTKLLRTLLNAHPLVFIPDVETHFLPHWESRWADYGDLSDLSEFQRFYNTVKDLPYFVYLAETQAVISCEDWYQRCENYSLPAVFEALLKHDAGYAADSRGIWGDKTPSYLSHIPMLKQLFPSARFIHIVRDVRDYCLSTKNAWGKSMLRAAQLWADEVTAACREGEKLGEDYMQLRYEDLIAEPESELLRICGFLDIDFFPEMLKPDVIAENLGDARGARDIVADNTNKYLTKMDAGMRDKIEALAGAPLQSFGYPVNYSGPARRLSPTRLKACKLHDGIKLLEFEVRNRGLLEACKLRWRLYTVSGNRVRN